MSKMFRQCKWIGLIALAIILLGLHGSAFAANALVNPGFEDGVTICNGDMSGGGYGWTYSMISGSNSFRPESYYLTNDGYQQGDVLYPTFHSGNEAIRFRAGDSGESVCYQDVYAKPNTQYTASVWVRGYSVSKGFGNDQTDFAELWIQELSEDGQQLYAEHKKSINHSNSAYEQIVADPFTTTASTGRISFILHTKIAADYTQGAVSYDDCVLEGQDATVSGTINDLDTGAPIEGATVTVSGKSAQTGADGKYLIEGVPTPVLPCAITATKAGYATDTKHSSIMPGTNTVDFVLFTQNSNLLANPGWESGAPDLWMGNGGASGSQYGWQYKFPDVMGYIQRESIFASRPQYFHNGHEAIAAQSAGMGTCLLWQDVPVQPAAQYTASVWVKGIDKNGQGFGSHPDFDSATLRVTELGADGNAIGNPREASINTATSDYQLLRIPSFTISSNTVTIKFELRSQIGCNDADGCVTYDDAILDGPAPIIDLSGTVTSGGAALAGAKVEIPTQNRTAVSGSDGKYAINALDRPTGAIKIRGSKDGYYTQLNTIDHLNGGTNTKNFNLVAVGNNLLINAGFDGDNGLEGWSTSGSASVHYETFVSRYDKFYFASGEQAVCIFTGKGNESASVLQTVRVKSGANYVARVKFRASAQTLGADKGVWGNLTDDQKAGLTVREYDSAGNLLLEHPMVYAKETRDWETLEFPFTTSAQTASATIVGYAYLLDIFDNNLGRATFDDFELNGPAPYRDVTSLADLKNAGENELVAVNGKVVTAAFNGFFYIEEQDRSAGIKVTGTATAGQIVNVTGKIQVVNGERTLVSDNVIQNPGGTIPKPLGMNNRAGSTGLSATGLYVTAWGKVDSVDAGNGFFTITDGSGASIKVYGNATQDWYVSVTGALGSEVSSGNVVPVVHAVSVNQVN